MIGEMKSFLQSSLTFFGKGAKREDFSELTEEQLKKENERRREKLVKDFRIFKVGKSLKELKGLNGLENLGNTCYMNAALQCLSQLPELSNYLLNKNWTSDLNTVNVIGSRGMIICQYVKLLEELWDGSVGKFAEPRDFRKLIEKENSMFEGFEQHDSSEFLSYLMDTMHEDLNRILKKPYIEQRDYKIGENLENFYKETISGFNRRNDSIFTDLFYGFFKSEIECPGDDCGHRSITFDPFNMVSLPLAAQPFSIYVMDKFGFFYLRKFQIRTAPETTIKSLKESIEKEIDIKAENSNFYFLGPDPKEIARRKKKGNYEFGEHQNIKNVMMPLDGKIDQTCSCLTSHGMDDIIFLVEDLAFPQLRESSEQVRVFFRHPFSQENSNLMKPLIVDSSICTIKLYQFALDMYNHSFEQMKLQEFTYSFEEAFGTAEEPLDYEDWPFYLKIDRKLVGINFKTNLEVDLADEQEILIQFEKRVLKTQNLGRNIRCSSTIELNTLEKNLDLYYCIRRFTHQETLDQENTWYCKKCKEHQKAKKDIHIHKLPRILILHLKRFSKYAISSYGKDTSFIKFPLTGLDLGEFTSTPSKSGQVYDLRGVIHHIGGLSSGHYYATCYNPYKNGAWVLYDDEDVKLSKSEEIISKTAYVLFYELREEGEQGPDTDME